MPEFSKAQTIINYECWGDNGSWVTLVNGHTRSYTDFRAMARFLVGQGFRVLSLDNRGSGQTKSSSDFTFDDLVADVKDLWLHLGIKSTYLLGISMGGMISQKLACQEKDIVKALVLVSTSPHQQWLRPRPEWGDSD